MTKQKKIRGMTWSDPRGYDPLVAAGAAFRERHPDVDIVWDKRSLQGFESTPVEELASTYDLIIIDHPHVGTVVEKNCLLPIDRLADADTLTRLSARPLAKVIRVIFSSGTSGPYRSTRLVRCKQFVRIY